MPTYNRRAFVPRAVRCFLKQDYPHRELLVVDDGDDPIGDCLPDDARIRYVRLDRRLTIGAKRNLACSQAHGEIIVHWDDDDWYPPHRVRTQVRALLDRNVDLCGSSKVYYYQPDTGRAWCYAYTGRGAAWVAGNTLAYRTCLWARNKFPDIQVGEDLRFAWSTVSKAVYDLADPALCVAMVHDTNTSPKLTGGAYWHPHPSAPIHALLGDDLPSYLTPTATVASVADAPPLVSCIMPTFNRRAFIPLALQAFASQDYRQKELIVVDDGSDPIEDLVDGR
jgi:glycosyltransferase involved in cell wall biosynthesis